MVSVANPPLHVNRFTLHSDYLLPYAKDGWCGRYRDSILTEMED